MRLFLGSGAFCLMSFTLLESSNYTNSNDSLNVIRLQVDRQLRLFVIFCFLILYYRLRGNPLNKQSRFSTQDLYYLLRGNPLTMQIRSNSHLLSLAHHTPLPLADILSK